MKLQRYKQKYNNDQSNYRDINKKYNKDHSNYRDINKSTITTSQITEI